MNENAAKEICLLNDSFPPYIDGVVNTVINYARVIRSKGKDVCVVTPDNPDADDSAFDYPVLRYPSIDTRKQLGYAAGIPFSISFQKQLLDRNIGIFHSHCPVMSNIVVRELKNNLDAPFIMTYHTRFDIDIEKIFKTEIGQAGAVKALIDSVSSCDELWAVSDGAGRSLQKLGYEGDYIVMPNGVDVPRGKASGSFIQETVSGYDLQEGLPVFLYVGRMKWYKGLRIILEALAALKSQGFDFRMVFVGSGSDEAEVKDLAEKLSLSGKCIFTGAIYDRKRITAWYSTADLFLFPSSYDTNGLVVREAAAASLASVLIKGSCAAEGITDMKNGFLIEENAASLAVCLTRLLYHPDLMKKAGEKACEELYYSWDDSVEHALERYAEVIENHKAGLYKKKTRPSDLLFDLNGNVMEAILALDKIRKSLDIDRII